MSSFKFYNLARGQRFFDDDTFLSSVCENNKTTRQQENLDKALATVYPPDAAFDSRLKSDNFVPPGSAKKRVTAEMESILSVCPCLTPNWDLIRRHTAIRV